MTLPTVDSKKSCYYKTCFGFPVLTSHLSPTLMTAWSQGVSLIAEQSLPVFSRRVRLTLFALQQLMTLGILIALPFFSPGNWIQLGCLAACVITNTLERVIGCVQSHRKSYDAVSDITRLFLTEICLYPAVITSFIDVLNSRSYHVVGVLWNSEENANASDTEIKNTAIDFSLNVAVVLLFILFVYVLKLVQVGIIVRSLTNSFKGKISGATFSAHAFIITFFVHVLAETVIHVLLLCLIVVLMLTDSPPQDGLVPVTISNYLITMIVCGELVTLLGSFLYFLSAQKWLEEFPIVLLIDHNPGNWPSASASEQIETEFKALHAKNTRCSGCIAGLIHPLMSPFQMLLCMIYAAVWILFAVSFPLKDVTSLEFSFGSLAAHTNIDTIVIMCVYGFVVLFSFFVNLLPIIFGLLGLALLPFWCVFYACAGCYKLCCD